MDGRPNKSIMPIGLRGVGKTVLLNRFHAMAQELDLSGAILEASETGDFKKLIAARLRHALELAGELDADADRVHAAWLVADAKAKALLAPSQAEHAEITSTLETLVGRTAPFTPADIPSGDFAQPPVLNPARLESLVAVCV